MKKFEKLIRYKSVPDDRYYKRGLKRLASSRLVSQFAKKYL